MDISGEKLTDQVYLCYGGGTAGAGIASRVLREMVSEGLSEEEAYKRFFMVDKQGLLFDDMDDLTPEQKPFAKKRADFSNADKLTDLLEVVKTVKPTILVGTSTQPNTFTKEIVEAMCENTERPMIFPLSNPTKLAEASAKDVYKRQLMDQATTLKHRFQVKLRVMALNTRCQLISQMRKKQAKVRLKKPSISQASPYR